MTCLPASTAQLIGELDRIVGPRGRTRDAAALGPYLRDWVGYAEGATPVMVQPANTTEVAEVVRACARHGAPIVPQGGNTSSVAGGIPHGEVLVSLRRDLHRAVYDVAVRLGGSFAAEHGIGTVKRGELARYRSGIELAMMRRLKNMLDPQGLMNPEKLLAAE